MSDFALIPGTLPASRNTYPATPQQLMEMLAEYMTVQFSQQSALFNFGEATPPPDRQNRPWVRTIGGRPRGIWVFYNGRWIRDWGVPLGVQMSIKDYAAPAFDFSGLATADEYVGWALCNGQNGTDDLRDRFILGYKDASTAPLDSVGGSKSTSLTIGGGLKVDLRKAQTFRGTTPGQVPPNEFRFVEDARDPQRGGVRYPELEVEGASSTTINLMNPYIVKAFIQYIGV